MFLNTCLNSGLKKIIYTFDYLNTNSKNENIHFLNYAIDNLR